MEETRTIKREKEIEFDTGFSGKATLTSLEDAGLITHRQGDQLEAGELEAGDLDLQLRPWLFCGEEPVAGIILEQSGEKISINEAARKNLLRRGTTLELLEAQAAVGAIIDPHAGEKLSVEEGIRRGLIDPYQVITN